MGIPSYFSHIVKSHREILTKYDQNRMAIHNLYMDCNSLIYDAVRAREDITDAGSNISSDDFEAKLIKDVCDKISSYILLINPKKRVYIAFDGVAPVAKLNQQRNRRYKSGFEARTISKLTGKQPETSWNTVAITPGTNFMSKLGSIVTKRFNKPSEYNLQEIIVSTSGEVGEGEHKIYAYIRKNPVYHKRTTTVIYGLDADLIMLTLNHLHIAPKMYLFRETPHFIKTLDSSLSPNSEYLLDIPLFGKLIAKYLNNNKEPTTEQQKCRVFDYIFLCFFLGNDFLPHFPALNIRTTGIDRLLSVYRKVIGQKKNKRLVHGTTIVWKNVKEIVNELANSEEQMLCDEYRKREKQSRNMKQKRLKPNEAFMSIPLLDRKEEVYINPYETGWNERYYNTLLDTRINDERRKEISLNYLEGLEWTFKYYTEGCVDWRWTYKYDYPPLLTDLCKYIPYFDTTMLPKSSSQAVSEYVQLSYVLPGSCLDLLPKHIESSLRQTYPHCYADNHEFCWAFCKYFWEAHAKMPEIAINELEDLLNQ